MNTGSFLSENGGLEQSFRSTETNSQDFLNPEMEGVPFISDGNDLTIGKFVTLFKAGALSGGLNFLLKIESDVAQFLLDITNDFSLGGCAERISTFSENLHEVVSKIAAGKIETKNRMRQSITYDL